MAVICEPTLMIKAMLLIQIPALVITELLKKTTAKNHSVNKPGLRQFLWTLNNNKTEYLNIRGVHHG